MESYDSIHLSVNQMLMNMSSRLKEIFDCRAMALLRGDCDVIRSVIDGV